jgi:NAD-dependent SIR2 family protein deacetylase
MRMEIGSTEMNNQISPDAKRDAELNVLAKFIADRERLLVITGAGISTDSGIGDYRDEAGQWKRPRPVSHQDFMASHRWRQRYWGRSQLGYPAFLRAQPNSAHRALARLETTGRMSALVTQNVDRLHQRAGHQSVIDLHGRLDQVICMECGSVSPRAAVQKWLETKNPQLQAQSFELAPDGDADLELDFSDVQVPDCEGCGGVLKPHVVFFGDSVEKTLVEEIMTTVAQSDGLLVVGSSLMVFSSFRFVRHAHQCAIPIAALNQGATRADELFLLKVARSSEALERLIPE